MFISLDQLIPNAKVYDGQHASMYDLVAGMDIMAATLLMV